MMSRTGKHARSDRYLFAGVEAPVAILEMQCDHPIAKAVEQGRHVGTPGIRPVGVDLQARPPAQADPRTPQGRERR